MANTLNLDKDTVSKYIDILEKAFIIFRLNPFSRNLRTEITKMRKIYFYDTGIRNALISNFNLLDKRPDKGALWENFLISERLKFNLINNADVKSYFWRTSQQQEVDYIEEIEGKLFAYEFTFSEKQKKQVSKTFLKNYKPEKEMIVNKNNYFEFLELLST